MSTLPAITASVFSRTDISNAAQTETWLRSAMFQLDQRLLVL